MYGDGRGCTVRKKGSGGGYMYCEGVGEGKCRGKEGLYVIS